MRTIKFLLRAGSHSTETISRHPVILILGKVRAMFCFSFVPMLVVNSYNNQALVYMYSLSGDLYKMM